MRRTRKQLKRTAYHEAGHAVIGWVLTLVCGGATIKPDGDAAGHSITHDPYACIYEWERRGKVRGKPDAREVEERHQRWGIDAQTDKGRERTWLIRS